MLPLTKNREYRNLAILQPSLQKRIDTDYYVEGYATTFNKPYELYEFDGVKYFEAIDRNALEGADISDVIMQYDHEGKVLARQSNKTLIIEADNNGLFICADLSKSAASKDLYEEIKAGLVTRMSWAFTVADEEYNRETRTRTIKKIKKVYDVSAVSIPANSDTEISARSYLNGVIKMERQELLERQKQKIKILIDLEDLLYEITRNRSQT
jgi:HK97 family phage prohead protease